MKITRPLIVTLCLFTVCHGMRAEVGSVSSSTDAVQTPSAESLLGVASKSEDLFTLFKVVRDYGAMARAGQLPQERLNKELYPTAEELSHSVSQRILRMLDALRPSEQLLWFTDPSSGRAFSNDWNWRYRIGAPYLEEFEWIGKELPELVPRLAKLILDMSGDPFLVNLEPVKFGLRVLAAMDPSGETILGVCEQLLESHNVASRKIVQRYLDDLSKGRGLWLLKFATGTDNPLRARVFWLGRDIDLLHEKFRSLALAALEDPDPAVRAGAKATLDNRDGGTHVLLSRRCPAFGQLSRPSSAARSPTVLPPQSKK